MKAKFLKMNNKGFSAINVIVGVLVLFLTFSLLIEFTLLGKRYSYMAQTSSYVARVMGEQGGIQNTIPVGYLDTSTYIKSSLLYNTLSNGFEKAGFDTWTIRINGNKFRSSTRIAIPEKEKIEITITAGFYPIFNFNNNSDRLVINQTKRIIYSSFTPRNEDLILIK